MGFAVRFDFVNKQEERLTVANLDQAVELLRETPSNGFVWLDWSADEVEAGRQCVERLCGEPISFGTLLDERPVPYFLDWDELVQFTLLDVEWSNAELVTRTVMVFLGTRVLITLHRHPSAVIEAVVQSYARDFRRVAQSPGFLLYELASHLCETYTQVVGHIADEAQLLQDNLLRQADETMFEHVSDLLRAVSEFHKVVVYSRELVSDLASRRSPMIPESTQPYLEKKAGLLERLGADVTSERELLSETVNLYLGIVTHRTNRTLSRLTVLGSLFLPLSFLAGVYGMNFDYLPELRWRYGYPLFWVVVLTFTVVLLAVLKRKRWL